MARSCPVGQSPEVSTSAKLTVYGRKSERMKLTPTGSQANAPGQISGIAAQRFGQSASVVHTSPVLVPVVQQFVPEGQPPPPSTQMPVQSASVVHVAPPIGWQFFFVGVTSV